MSKHKKSSRKQLSRVEKILLATAIANLINAVITLATEIIKHSIKPTEGRGADPRPQGVLYHFACSLSSPFGKEQKMNIAVIVLSAIQVVMNAVIIGIILHSNGDGR